MGTLNNDSVLNKLRALEMAPVRGCAVTNCGQTSGAPVHHGYQMGETEPHDYVEPLDEPIFVFRAQDQTAVLAVQYWMNYLNPDLPPEKREEAAEWCAKALAWPKKKAAD